jgi:hypothetical protein
MNVIWICYCLSQISEVGHVFAELISYVYITYLLCNIVMRYEHIDMFSVLFVCTSRSAPCCHLIYLLYFSVVLVFSPQNIISINQTLTCSPPLFQSLPILSGHSIGVF